MTEAQYKSLKRMKITLDAVLEDHEKALQPKRKRENSKEKELSELEIAYATRSWKKPLSLRKSK